MTLSCVLKTSSHSKAVNQMLMLHLYCWAVERHLVLLKNHPHCKILYVVEGIKSPLGAYLLLMKGSEGPSELLHPLFLF